ncbi:MAG: hypothetical protein E7357_02845 [Clostridiales bacterium]|nr:hypothetical protein [Clostridiales bacterium]
MKSKKFSKKIALWTAGLVTLCVGAIAVPQIVRAADVPDTVAETFEPTAGAPRITLDTMGYDVNNAPCAVVGKDYRIFNATAQDSYDNEVKVATRVWLYYYSTTKSRVEVKDGVFVPQQTGEYVVEYTATDASGNKAVFVYAVPCVEKGALKITLGDKTQTCITGEKIAVASANLENVSGKVDLQVQIKHKDGKETQVLNGDSFTPMYEGVYVVEYSADDYLETATASYEITVGKNETPVFVEDVSVPKYFLRDKAYVLPVPKAYHFVFGSPVEMIPVVTVEYENGETVTVENGAFTPIAEGNVTVKYSLTYGNAVTQLTYAAKVVNVDYGQLNSYEKYFDGDDYTMTLTADYIELFTMTDGAAVDFINPLFAKKVNVVFAGSAKYKNYESVELYLTDSNDPTVQVKVSFREKTGGGLIYTVNDETEYTMQASLFSGEKITFAYADDDKTFNVNNTLDVFFGRTLGGETFNGFPSGKAYLTMKMTGVDGAAAISMYKLGNQNFNYNAMDAVPEIAFSRHNGGERKIGEVVELLPFYVSDVLDYDCLVNFYVLDPDGEFVTALDGTLLDGSETEYSKPYSIVMEKTGIYNICMEVSDTLSNKQLYAYGISVVDRTPPKIRLVKGETQFTVGDVTVWEATATDVVGTELDVYVYVYKPDGKIIEVKEGVFNASTAGTYTVFYQAMDAEKNSTIESYEIIVS